MIKKSFNIVILLTIMAFALSAYIFTWISLSTGPATENKIIVINKGSILNVANQLAQQEAINNKLTFALVAGFANYFARLKAGEYAIEVGASNWNIIRLMQSGAFFKRSITIPEGLTTAQILSLVEQNSHLVGQIDKAAYKDGDLLPETYFFIHGEKKLDVLNRMSAFMKKAVAEAWEQRTPTLPLKTKEELLTLASIIEKEAKVKEEQPIIASVFINRIMKDMKLESDPTTIYSITKGKYLLERSLTRMDLKKQSPFNTYAIKGLPPTPISNPGLSSIKAAANPATTKYIFFVVKDCQGNHNFSSKLNEHNAYVSQYRKLKCNSLSTAPSNSLT